MGNNTMLVYCDESCHLQHDGSDVMVLGAMVCPEVLKNKVFFDIRQIKEKHGLNTRFEIKWTKISESKIDFYLDLVKYFFSAQELSFRAVIIKNKSKLDHSKFNDNDHDLWYYKMYYQLLNPIILSENEYRIFIDIKDTKGGSKIKTLQNVLCNNIYDFKQEVIKDIRLISSNESEILQLNDLLIGSLSFFNRGLFHDQTSSIAKRKVISTVLELSKTNLSSSTPRYEEKFNLFVWTPRVVL
ncbi:DUF3800 domain-containing protein [Brevibacillus borstelensis]|uniref:DUF3800 domain-containing protein n=1 Tax=Brevibacillus borstelensis TaxID=45462 RepID=UPI00203AADCC|nr:DUF3800 domain-containing protein [Brevibacillus borstelensis]MCM3560569.1 DUF3800 domain-containing protein [Brevibacillus borstelensis]